MPTQQVLLSHAQLTDGGTPHAERHSDRPDGSEFAECGLSALRLVPVPDTGPPFDGGLPADAIAAAPTWSSEWGLADRDHYRCPPAVADSWAGGSTHSDTSAHDSASRCTSACGGAHPGTSACGGASPGARTDGGASAGVQSKVHAGGAKPTGSRPEDEWSRLFALLLTETLAGARPLRQLVPWTTDRARGHLDKLRPLFSGGQRPRVQRVITSRPTPDAIEMTVVVGVGTRTRAIAVRLERIRRSRQKQWPGETARPRLPAPAGQAAVTRPGATAKTTPQWLCTDIEAA